MSSNKDFEQVSSNVIDMLVGSTLKKHGVKLEAEKIDSKQKEELKSMVENLRKSVASLTEGKKEKKEE